MYKISFLKQKRPMQRWHSQTTNFACHFYVRKKQLNSLKTGVELNKREVELGDKLDTIEGSHQDQLNHHTE